MIDDRESTLARAAAERGWVVRGERYSAVVGTGWRTVVGRLQSMADAFVCWQSRHAARLALEALDDRLLKDIGLRRDQIDLTVDAMFRRKPSSPATARVAVAVEGHGALNSAANDGDYKSAA
jgi:uncharacterized protein YjiS (DUF1127 family)